MAGRELAATQKDLEVPMFTVIDSTGDKTRSRTVSKLSEARRIARRWSAEAGKLRGSVDILEGNGRATIDELDNAIRYIDGKLAR